MTWESTARVQCGVISTSQLHQSGLEYRDIKALVAQGVVRRVGRGTLVVSGARVDWRRRLWVGVVSAGAGAFLWRRSAAALWEMDGIAGSGLDSLPLESVSLESLPVEVAVAVGEGRRPAGARRLSIDPTDLVRLDGLLVTGAARTLCDLGSAVDADVVERAVECALRRKLVSLRDLTSYAASRRSPGSRVLRAVVGRRAGAPPTASDLETLFLQLARSLGLPEPERQVRVVLRGRTYYLDFAWRSIRLAVEIDGAGTHGPGQLTSDLRRQNEIILDGWTVLRFSWEMVVHEIDYVGGRLMQAYGVCSLGV